MRRSALAVLAVVAIVATAGAALSSGASYGASNQNQTIHLLNVGSLPVPNLDFFHSFLGVVPLRLGLESLVGVGHDGRVHPHLAKSVRQKNPVTYVYALRKGVKFWDGNELTATDAATSLNYYRSRGSQAAYVYGTSVRSITATGRYTLVVKLKHPDATWQYVLALAGTGIFEKKFADQHEGALGRPGVLTMGTGPWQIVRFDPTTGVELDANPHYWGGPVPIQHISVKFFADENSEALAFRAGTIDLALQLTDPRAFTATSGVKPLVAPGADTGIFVMNVKAAPWSDVHVRRAVAYALNRATLIKASGGYAVPNYTLIPPNLLRALGSPAQVNSLLNSLPKYSLNLAKARAELAKSAYPNGFSTTLPTLNQGTYPAVTQVVAAGLQAIGIKAKVKLLPPGAFYGALTTPSQRPTHFDIAVCVSPDPGNCYNYLLGSNNTQQGSFNIANYAPPAVDALIRSGLETVNPAKRLAVYGRLLRRIALDVPYVSLWLHDATATISSKFEWPGFDWNYLNRVWGLEIRAK